MIDSTIHFKSQFDIVTAPNVPIGEQWASIIKEIGAWLVNKANGSENSQEITRDKWIFHGGEWQNIGGSRMSIIVRTCFEDGDIPKFWALRVEHPDTEHCFRIWRVDIGLTNGDDNKLKFSLVVCYYTKFGYIGREFPAPKNSAPKFLRNLIAKCYWVGIGNERITLKPNIIELGDGKNLADRVKDPNRVCPLVFVAMEDYINRVEMIEKLYLRLLGNASFNIIQDDRVIEEINYYIGGSSRKMYHIRKGTIRIFQPKVSFNVPKDSNRHRFYVTSPDIDISDNIEEIVRGLYRIEVRKRNEAVETIEDVAFKQRERKLSVLKDQITKSRDYDLVVEYITLQEEQIENLKNKLEEARLQNEVGIEDSLKQRREFEEQLVQKEFAISQLKFQRNQSEIREREETDLETVIRSLEILPCNVVEVLELAKVCFKSRIVFLNEAITSARKTQYEDVSVVWRILWHCYNSLWNIAFKSTTQELIPNEFKRLSGFELAMTEGSSTKKDRRIMQTRRLIYNERQIDITPHIKHDKQGKYLRVHLFLDTENELIVIGHCGDHMDTAGTRRQ